MSPKIGTVQGAAIRVIWWEIQLKIETNPCSPRIGTVRETASNFEGVFRHFVMNLSDCFWLQATVYVHGRDNQLFPPSLVHKEWLNLALTFSAAALRGSPHSSHHQKQIQISLMVRRAGLSTSESLCPKVFREHVKNVGTFKIGGPSPLQSHLIQIRVAPKSCFWGSFLEKILVLTDFDQMLTPP